MDLKRLLAILVALSLLTFAWSCDEDDEEEPQPTPSGEETASGTFTSDEEGIISTPAGARVYIPEGAVPRQPDGSSSTMVFSIEVDDDYSVTPPDGEVMQSDVYRFGPEGFVFERPVTVEIPLGEGIDPGEMEVNLYRVNPTTGEAELFNGECHYDEGTVSAQTYHFSPWFITGRQPDPQGTGCIWVDNRSVKWVSLCAVPDSLRYPDRDFGWIPAEGLTSSWAPWNHNIGVTNQGEMWVPQGWYRVCVTYYHDPGDHDVTYTHRWLPDQVVVDNAARSSWLSRLQNYDCTELIVGGDGLTGHDYIDGRCNCIPPPTIPVGTGDIQVTLTWFNLQSLDLDLWVTDPSGERCYYGNNPSSSGGTLDRDNLCGNYENGRPENIFWSSNPPAGEYIVEVDWFSACSNQISSQSFNVRTVVQGNTNTYDRVIHSDETIEVIRFTIGSAGQTFAAGAGRVDRTDVERPAKN